MPMPMITVHLHRIAFFTALLPSARSHKERPDSELSNRGFANVFNREISEAALVWMIHCKIPQRRDSENYPEAMACASFRSGTIRRLCANVPFAVERKCMN